MLQTFLTGLREGLEAALVASILMSFLVRSGHRDRIPALWIGVGVAVIASLAFGGLLHYTSANMSFEAQETFAGIISISQQAIPPCSFSASTEEVKSSSIGGVMSA